jgi:hypothetical protein
MEVIRHWRTTSKYLVDQFLSGQNELDAFKLDPKADDLVGIRLYISLMYKIQ